MHLALQAADVRNSVVPSRNPAEVHVADIATFSSAALQIDGVMVNGAITPPFWWSRSARSIVIMFNDTCTSSATTKNSCTT